MIDRLKVVEGLPNLIVADSDLTFAQRLVDGKAIPQAAFTDAVHVAVAARHLVPYLATWNFTHLANPQTRPKIEQICHDAGYPLEVTPHCLELTRGDTGGTFMCDDPVKDIQKAKARLAALFGDLETYMEFLMKQQKKRMKQGPL